MLAWLIEHILNNLPSWLWPIVAGSGFGVYFFAGVLGHFPSFKPYSIFIKPIGILVCIGGIFMYGGAGITAIYEARMKDLQAQIDSAEDKSKGVNTGIQTKVITQTKVIHDTKIVVQKEIQHDAQQMDADCKLDPIAIKDLNDAAKNPLGATK